MAAKVVPEDEEAARALNLIRGHMGDREWIDLPSDDPDTSYERRKNFAIRVLRGHREVLEDMFGG